MVFGKISFLKNVLSFINVSYQPYFFLLFSLRSWICLKSLRIPDTKLMSWESRTEKNLLTYCQLGEFIEREEIIFNLLTQTTMYKEPSSYEMFTLIFGNTFIFRKHWEHCTDVKYAVLCTPTIAWATKRPSHSSEFLEII